MPLKFLIVGFLLACSSPATAGALLRGEVSDEEASRELKASPMHEVSYAFKATMVFRDKSDETLRCIERNIAENVVGFGKNYLVQVMNQDESSAEFGRLHSVVYKDSKGKLTLKRDNAVKEFNWEDGWATKLSFGDGGGGDSEGGTNEGNESGGESGTTNGGTDGENGSEGEGGTSKGGGRVSEGGWVRKQRALPEQGTERNLEKRKQKRTTIRERSSFRVRMRITNVTVGQDFGSWMSDRLGRQIVSGCKGVKRAKKASFTQFGGEA